MKELTIEQKAQRYDKALEKARQLCAYPTTKPFISDLYDLFPELAESEDERIRKAIINVFASHKDYENFYGASVEDILAWLEKQATPQVRTGLEWVNTIDDACDKRYAEEYAHGEYCHEQSFKWGFQEGVDWLEKQCEDSPVLSNSSNTGKVEQKPNDNQFTPEQAGVLDKHIDKFLEQNRTWSEEDEQYVKDTLALLAFGVSVHTISQVQDWLNSLKDKYTWKPSEEQVRAIDVVRCISNRYSNDTLKALESLYQDLKKLREE